jgi:diguanylate cyclase (GGDEF)-like protein/PAS domain S-box-containing protein
MAELHAVLGDRAEHLHEAQQLSRVGSWERYLDEPAIRVSDAFLELYGLTGLGDTIDVAMLLDSIHPDDRAPFQDSIARLRVTGQTMNIRYRVVRPSDRNQRWLCGRAFAERDSDGAIVRMVGTVTDITEFVLAELHDRSVRAELTQAHNYQQAVITAVPDVIHIYDVATKQFVRANRSARPLIGFTDELMQVMSGSRLDQLLRPQDSLKLNRLLAAAQTLPDGQVLQIHHPVTHADGQTRWLSRRMTPFARDAEGIVTLVLVVSRDMTDIVTMEHELEHAAMHDDLTGLPNRRLIHDRITQSLRRAARGGRVAVLVCDLDGFKRINDSRGHRTGDEVLVEVARRLQQVVRSGDTVARQGGDEFLVVLDITDGQDPAELAEHIATRIGEEVGRPIWHDGHAHTVSASIGISLDRDNSTAETLLSDADVAMYYVKHHGANGHVIYHPSQRPDIARLDRIEREIRRALADDTVEVFYQPIVNPITNRVYGVEALVRIRDTTGAFLNAAHVIDVAERTGLIAALDERVLALACARAAAWRRTREHRDLKININRSVRDISKPGFYGRIMQALADSGLAAEAMTIEITETVLLDATEGNLADLRALSERGIGLAIDDFGTGYASLRYLAELPITSIKLDRSFTVRLPDDPIALTLISATMGLAEQLGISCTVEGVETTAQLASLPVHEATLIQGYLYARPQCASDPLPEYIFVSPELSGAAGRNQFGEFDSVAHAKQLASPA